MLRSNNGRQQGVHTVHGAPSDFDNIHLYQVKNKITTNYKTHI